VTRGRRLTLAEERAIVAKAREFPRLSPADCEELYRELFGIAALEQLKAAAAETERNVLALGGRPPYIHHQETTSWELGMLLWAGVIRCLKQSACEHATPRGGHPVTAILVARVIACDRCLPRYKGAIVAAHRRNLTGEDRLCDLCLEEPANSSYRPFIAHYGAARVVGDYCDECHALGEEEARAAA
jgi:hypothetical protein